MGNPPGLAQTVCWGVGCRGEPMSAMRRSHALAVQREGAQRIEQGSGGNGRGVGSGQWVGSGPRKGDIAQTVLAAAAITGQVPGVAAGRSNVARLGARGASGRMPLPRAGRPPDGAVGLET